VIVAPPAHLAVSPPRLVVAAGETRAIRVTNEGSGVPAVVVTTAGYAVGLRGRPRIVVRRPAEISVRPRRLEIPAGRTETIAVTAVPGASPGDHAALVLVSGAVAGRGVGVRLRIGVVVLVRGRGTVAHRLRLGSLRPHKRTLELLLENRGNVTEHVDASRVHVVLRAGRRTIRLRPVARELLPQSRGICVLRYGAHVRGRVRAQVTVDVGGRLVRRSYALVLP